MRKAIALLLLLGLLAAGAAAEEPLLSPGTPTDLCPHEHTQEIYYFDHPEYIPLDEYSHLIRGIAIVNTVCDDCGQVIRSETQTDAEQTRIHIFKKGICVLCGQAEPHLVPPEQEELEVFTVDDEETAYPEEETYLEFRVEDGNAALILPANAVRAEESRTGAKLSVEIMEEEDRVYTALRMGGDSFRMDGIVLRIYGRKIDIIFFTGTEETRSLAQNAEWAESGESREGYSFVPWVGNGYYKYLEE